MTTAQIEKRQSQANVPYEVAKQIRALLDAARKEYGPTQWDENDVQCVIQELVFED